MKRMTTLRRSLEGLLVVSLPMALVGCVSARGKLASPTTTITPTTAGWGNEVRVNDPNLIYAVLAFLGLVAISQMYFQFRRLRLHVQQEKRACEQHTNGGYDGRTRQIQTGPQGEETGEERHDKKAA